MPQYFLTSHVARRTGLSRKTIQRFARARYPKRWERAWYKFDPQEYEEICAEIERLLALQPLQPLHALNPAARCLKPKVFRTGEVARRAGVSRHLVCRLATLRGYHRYEGAQFGFNEAEVNQLCSDIERFRNLYPSHPLRALKIVTAG